MDTKEVLEPVSIMGHHLLLVVDADEIKEEKQFKRPSFSYLGALTFGVSANWI